VRPGTNSRRALGVARGRWSTLGSLHGIPLGRGGRDRHWRASPRSAGALIVAARMGRVSCQRGVQYGTASDHRITNATSGGLDSKIRSTHHDAFGSRNREHLRTPVFFRRDGLNLLPATYKRVG
jgi:hypothetical protein